MQHARKFLALFSLLLLALATGCANDLSGKPLEKARNAQDSLQYGYAAVATSYRTVANLADRGRIKKADAVKLIANIDATRAALDASVVVGGPNGQTDALAILNAALSVLESKNPEAAAYLKAAIALVQAGKDPQQGLLTGALNALITLEAVLKAKG